MFVYVRLWGSDIPCSQLTESGGVSGTACGYYNLQTRGGDNLIITVEKIIEIPMGSILNLFSKLPPLLEVRSYWAVCNYIYELITKLVH